MQTISSSPKQLVEAFLIIEQPRQRLGHWQNALAALDSPFAPTIAEVIAYYDPTCDQALIALRYDEAGLDDTRLEYVMNVAILAEVGMVQPAEISEGERARFFAERLPRCSMRITTERTAVGGLRELVARLKSEGRATPPPIPTRAQRAESPVASSIAPRGDTSDSMPVVTAKGTRDDLDCAARDAVEHVEEQNTSPMGQAAMQALRTKTRRSGVVLARYLRGGRWVAVRVGALSLKGAALLTGALPRLHDRIEVELSFGDHRAFVGGIVTKVSTSREARTTGASTFSVLFELTVASRKQLTGLLVAARDAKITIKPPPPRRTRRYPVELQLALGTAKGAFKAIALDVSAGGMFVSPAVALELGSTVTFSIVLDDATTPVYGRARVVRMISEADAAACDLSAGYGLAIDDMSESDRMRWIGFLARIERRVEKRVLIGADPRRLKELQSALASLGYTAVGGTDPGTLVQLANACSRPADAVLIDAGWLQNAASATLVENLFSARNVPCVTMQGEVRRARLAIDRLLEVVV